MLLTHHKASFQHLGSGSEFQFQVAMTVILPLYHFTRLRWGFRTLAEVDLYANKWSKQYGVRPQRRKRMAQSYSPDGINVPHHEGTLAPPGKYD